MAQDRFLEPSSTRVDIGRVVKDEHERIMALFRLYLGSPADSRQAIVEEILHRLAMQLEKEERLFQEIKKKSGLQAQKLVGDTELEHEKIKVMILELQQSEADDDQALDEFFEEMMQSVRALFRIEERDLLPLVDRSLDS